jgi:hypothetical protein
VTPAQAVALLSEQIDFHESIPALVRMLRDGLLRSAARHVILGGRDPQKGDYVYLTPKAWTRASLSDPRNALWRTGAFEASFATEDRYNAPHHEFSFHGIRFEPEGVSTLLSDSAYQAPSAPLGPPTPEGADAKVRGSPLSSAERQRFAKLYLDNFGADATESRAYQAIVASYPDKFIARDPFLADFRAIRGPQVLGRKGKTEK